MNWFVVPAEEPTTNSSPEQQEPEGQKLEEQELEEQVVVNKDEDIHNVNPPEKRFTVRLERANSEQKVGLAILNKGKRCKVFGVKPGGVAEDWNKENPTQQIMFGDHIRDVDGFTDYQTMRQVLLENHTMHLTIERD